MDNVSAVSSINSANSVSLSEYESQIQDIEEQISNLNKKMLEVNQSDENMLAKQEKNDLLQAQIKQLQILLQDLKNKKSQIKNDQISNPVIKEAEEPNLKNNYNNNILDTLV